MAEDKTGNTVGKIIGQAPASNVKASEANKVREPETEEEKSLWESTKEWFSERGDEVAAAIKDPVEGIKGTAKGLWNMIPDTIELIGKGGVYQAAGEQWQAAGIQSLLGQDELAKQSIEMAESLQKNVDSVSMEKFRAEMSNDAQRGGDVIATTVGLVTGLAGVGKGIAKATAKGAKLESSVARIVENSSDGAKIAPRIVKENIQQINPNDVRLSQKTVSYNKTDRITGEKYTYDDLVDSMKKDGWVGDPVDVVRMPDGKLTSMDNTRITAAREAGIDIKANVRDFNEALPSDMIESGRFGDAGTWGEASTSRINKQGADFRNEFPHGSPNSPKITGKSEGNK